MTLSFWAVTDIPICRKTCVLTSLHVVFGSSFDKNTCDLYVACTPLLRMLSSAHCISSVLSPFPTTIPLEEFILLFCAPLSLPCSSFLCFLLLYICLGCWQCLGLSKEIRGNPSPGQSSTSCFTSLLSITDWSIEASDLVSYTEDRDPLRLNCPHV